MTKDIWVISDTHFSHENIIKYCDRPFTDRDYMDEHMIDKWNSVVKPGDKVYHLGDVYMGEGGQERFAKIAPRLLGQKRLILGNHDNGKDKLLQSVFQKIGVWRMFSEFGLLLTHVPVHPSSLTRIERKAKWSNDDQKYLVEATTYNLKNIHGHTHTNAEPDGDTKNYKCVCVELIDYTPVHIEELRIK